MPYMVNGFGTKYVGKKGVFQHVNVCEKCGYEGVMQSYETRLWFTTFFIPLIPLQRTMVLDYCPHCTEHQAMSLAKWKRFKLEKLAQGQHLLREHPDDPDVAIVVHHDLFFLDELDKAKEMARDMGRKFSQDADVQFYLGSFYESLRMEKESDRHYQNSFELNPDNEQNRRAMGIISVRKGDLARASDYLEFMMRPGPNQDVKILFYLAGAFQGRGDHFQALQVFRVITRDFPQLAKKDKKLREAIKKAEQATGSGESILPRRSFVLNKWTGFAAAGVMIAILGFMANMYLKNHQELVLVNGFQTLATVTIPGLDPVTVAPQSHQTVDLPEGIYQVETSVKDGGTETVELNLKRRMLARMFANDVFLLNVNGGAVLIWEQATYSENPDLNTNDPYLFYVNHRFLHLRSIDYPFSQFPLSIAINAGETVRKSRVDALYGSPDEMFSYIQAERNITPYTKLTFLENHLAIDPNNPALLHVYAQAAMQYNLHGHANKFLRPHLRTRPVMIHVHRLYQDIRAARSPEQEESMRRMYDSWCEVEPRNANLLFLRGRIGRDRREKERYFAQAIGIDPDNPYPHHSSALLLARKGDYTAAMGSIDRAMRANNTPFYMEPCFYSLHLARGDYHTLQATADAIVKIDPMQIPYMERVLETIFLSGQPEKMAAAIKDYSVSVKKKTPNDPFQLVDQARAKIQYLNKDFAGLREKVERIGTLYFLQDYQLAVLLNDRKIKAAGKLLEEAKNDDPYKCLVMWMAWLQQDKPDRATPFLKQARELLNTRRRVDQTIARLLEGKSRDIMGEMDNIAMRPEYNRQIYTAMAVLYPQQWRKLLQIAERLNTLPRFPYHFLSRTHQWLRDKF